MKIIIETIPHKDHRYSTVGDWYYRHTIRCPKCEIESETLPIIIECPKCGAQIGDLQFHEEIIIKVSKLSDWRREMLVAVHELVEVLTCKHDGVTQEQVDKFDMEFEKHRHPDNHDEAGDDVAAPYKFQHSLATGIERILAQQWGVTWKAYEDELNSLP